MSKIETANLTLSADDPTFGMDVFEDDTGFCTRLIVMRNGAKMGVVIHHGPNTDYSGKIPPMYVPSLEGENPVGLMMQMSEEHRHDLRWWRKTEEYRQSSTLIKDAIRQDEQDRLTIRNQSVFGPHVVKQRNGFSRETNRRAWFDERARRTGKIKSLRKVG